MGSQTSTTRQHAFNDTYRSGIPGEQLSFTLAISASSYLSFVHCLVSLTPLEFQRYLYIHKHPHKEHKHIYTYMHACMYACLPGDCTL